MSGKNLELRVGLVIFLALIILGYGVIWLKDYKFNVKRFHYAAIFPEVGSLGIGDPVAVLGVTKGEVEKIDLKGGEVYVTFNLTKDVILKKDAEFTVMNIGLMGERFIRIKPGISDTLLDLTVPKRGFYDTGIPEVMGMMGRGIDEIRELIRILKGTIGTEQATTDMKEIISNTVELTRRTKSLMDSIKAGLMLSTKNLAYSSAKIREIVDSNQAGLQRTITNMDSASYRFLYLTDELTEISGNLKTISNRLLSDDNTLGKMLKDRELYDRLNTTTVNLDSLILDIKRNPKKYIHLEIF